MNYNLESDSTITSHRSFGVMFTILMFLGVVAMAVIRLSAPMLTR